MKSCEQGTVLQERHQGWIISNGPNKLRLKFSRKPHTSIWNYCWWVWDFHVLFMALLLPEDHTLYKMYKRAIRNVTISQLLDDFESNVLALILNQMNVCRIIPCELEFDQNGDHLEQDKQYSMWKDCLLLTSSGGICLLGDSFTEAWKISTECQHFCTFQCSIVTHTSQQTKVSFTTWKIENHNAWKWETLFHLLFVLRVWRSTMNSPFMKLFWEQQTKLEEWLQKYHPMIIRFCLSLASKSNSQWNFYSYFYKLPIAGDER